MPPVTIQIPSIILPTVWTLGTEREVIDDLVVHTSIEFSVEYLQEKSIHILAIEAVAAGVPGNLWCWVELSPYPTTITGAYWAAIGGGGGVLPPVVPLIEVATGVNLAVHGITIPWDIHSTWARVVVQTPVAAGLPLAFWAVQCQVSAKTP